MLHAKTVVADGRWVRVGSSNLNHSSLLANYELDVLVDSVALGSQMEAQFRRDLDQSCEVTTRPLRGLPRLSRKLPPALAIYEPGRASPVRLGRLGDRRRRSMLALRTLVAGAKLAILGPLALVLAVVGILFFLFPGPMASGFGVLSIWLAIVSGAELLRRRQDPGSRTG
jgi:hypothetical protein